MYTPNWRVDRNHRLKGIKKEREKAFQPGNTRSQAGIDQFKDMTQVQNNDSYQIMIQMVSVGKHLK